MRPPVSRTGRGLLWPDVQPEGATRAQALELERHDGRVLRTRISRPANRESYGPALWKLILTEQLSVTEEQFWACVKDRRLPDRGGDSGDLPSRQCRPSWSSRPLNIGLPETQVAQMTLEEAVATMTEHRSRPRE